MASTILSRTISAVEDKRVVLSAGEILRPLPWGTNWSAIRIGVVVTMTDPGATLGVGKIWAVGLCAGTVNPYSSGSTHFIGVDTDPVNCNLTRQAGAPTFYYMGGAPAQRLGKKVGATFTYAAHKSSSQSINADPANGYRRFWAVDIIKGATWTVKLLCNNYAVTTDVVENDIRASLERFTPAITGDTAAAGTGITIDEATYGYFNTLNILWNSAAANFEFSKIYVTRMQ